MEVILGIAQIAVLAVCARRAKLPLFCVFLLAAALRNLAHPWLASWSSPLYDVPLLVVQIGAAVEGAAVLMADLRSRERYSVLWFAALVSVAAVVIAVSAEQQPGLIAPTLAHAKTLVRVGCGVFVLAVLLYCFRRPWEFQRRAIAHCALLLGYFVNASVAALRPLQTREQWQASHDTYLVVLLVLLAAWVFVFSRRADARSMALTSA